MTDLIIDSDVIVRYLKTADGILKDILGEYKLHILPTIYTEILSSNRAKDKSGYIQLKEFLDKNFKVIDINKDIAEKASSIIKENDIVLASALTAAASLIKDFPLLTYGLEVYDKIPDIKLIDV